MSTTPPEEPVMADVPTSAPAPEAAKQKGSSWAETKGDLKWAAVALLVVLLIVYGARLSTWQGPTSTEEDLGAVTEAIFSQDGLVAPFEILSVLLLAALIAGIAIAARDPLGRPPVEESPASTLEEREI